MNVAKKCGEKKGHLHSRGVVVWGTRDLTADALNLIDELGA